MNKKFEFYDIRKLLKSYPDCYYYLIFGERSNGKTYSALDYALERYGKAKEQFAYIRRYGEDIRRKNLSTLFDGHVNNGEVEKWSDGKYTSVDYTGGKFYMMRHDEEVGLIKDETPMGFAFDLNSMEHFKSTSFPNVRTIIFDEFISRSAYLPNEWILFTNTLSTIIRLRNDIKILMLGNTVNKYCPYFNEMGLTHIKEQKPGTVDIYQYSDTELKVACEYTGSSTKKGGKPSDVYFAFDNPELKMITSGTWEIAIYPHLDVKYRPKDVIFNFFVEFDGEVLHGEIIEVPNNIIIFLHSKTTPIKDVDNDIVYTDRPSSKWNYRMCISHQRDKLSLFIMNALYENRIFYSTNEVGEIFRNYVIFSDSQNIKN